VPYPTLSVLPTQRLTADSFRGLNRNLRIGDGEFSHTENLTADHAPLLATRRKRSAAGRFDRPAGLIAKDALAVVDGSDVVYGGKRIALGLNDTAPKQLVSMGAYLVIFPDKIYLNTADLEDFGTLEAAFTSAEPVTCVLADAYGTPYADVMAQDNAPAEPGHGSLWLDTASDAPRLLRYDAAAGLWTEQTGVCTRIEAPGIGQNFDLFDGITVEHSDIEAINGSHVIRAKDDGFIAVEAVISAACVRTSGEITVTRTVPDMDFVCEAGNRLWGCKYGLVNGEPVNEIYGCKLGDFKNWNCFMGISTDSWAASVGSDGPFTAAVNYLGCPTFFKENGIHTVRISPSGGHQVQETVCSGVQNGSWRSVAVAGERLFYKGITAVYAYDGSLPVPVSGDLGEVRYHSAVAGALGGKYCICMQNQTGAFQLFVYDTRTGIWMREDSTEAVMFAAAGEELFFLRADGVLVSMTGQTGEAEGDFRWEAVSGIQFYRQPGKKYVSRYLFRLQLQPGEEAKLSICYDSSGVWEEHGAVKGSGLGSVLLPVIPRRCDHLQWKLEGRGEMRLFSLTRTLEEGSDT